MKKAILYGLYFSILGMLFLPHLLKRKNILKSEELKGKFEVFNKPLRSLSIIKSGEYQEKFNAYVDHNFGGRTFLIRCLNQLKFFLFHQSDAPGVVVGKYNYLYLSSYTNNYMGLNFVGFEKIDETVKKLKQIQDSLKKFDVDLLIVFAPGKASFYSEFLPDYMNRQKKQFNNHGVYSAAFAKYGVNYLDLNSWFVTQKRRTRYALYPELGVHYTPHGTFLSTDTIVRYIEKMRNIDLPDVSKYTVYLSDSLREQEHDVEELMNLREAMFHQPVPYFKLETQKNETHVKPDLLAIGDSYWWQITGLDLPKPFFKRDVYWYYNNSVYINNVKQEKTVGGLHYGDEILGRDVVVIMASEATYDLFPYGFIEKAFPVLCMNSEQKTEMLKKQAKNDSNWMADVKQKAAKNNISEEAQLMKDIEYVINTDLTAYKAPKQFIDSVVHSYRNKIINNTDWYASVKKKAAEKYIPLEKQINLDAKFGYGMDYGTEEAIEKMNQIKIEIRKNNQLLLEIKNRASITNCSFNEAMAWEIKRLYDLQKGK